MTKRDPDALFLRASAQWDEGNCRSAFRLFLNGAKAGDMGAQTNLGTFYAEGIGVKPNLKLALYWYKRAYRQGSGCAASNIACVLRDRSRVKLALAWFERATQAEDADADAHLEIAKIYLARGDQTLAIPHLRCVCQAEPEAVTKAAREEAEELFKRWQ